MYIPNGSVFSLASTNIRIRNIVMHIKMMMWVWGATEPGSSTASGLPIAVTISPSIGMSHFNYIFDVN